MGKPSPEASDLLALEDRVLYSAAPIPVDLVDVLDANPQEHSLDTIDTLLDQLQDSNGSTAPLYLMGTEFAADPFDPTSEIGLDQLDGIAFDVNDSEAVMGSTNELVFVDTTLEGYEQILSELLESSRQVEIILLQPDQDGIQQITQALQSSRDSSRDVSTIHLITHGADGRIQFGDQLIGQGDLGSYSDELSTWQDALTDNADLIIYGCDVAQTEFGESFVRELSQLTKMDVASSNDATGHSDLGGDWDFEFTVGAIESEQVFSQQFVENWSYALSIQSPTTTTPIAPSDDHDIGADFYGGAYLVQSSDVIAASLGKDIYLTRYDTAGTMVVSNQKINDFHNGDQFDVQIAVNDMGEFAVVWTSDVSGDEVIKAKFFNDDGTVEVGEFQVNEMGTEGQNASVAINDAGEIVIAWEGSGTADTLGIYAKRFDRHGVAIADAFLVNSETTGNQLGAAVAMNGQGDWVIGWYDFVDTNSQTKAYFSVYDHTDTLVLDNVVARDDNSVFFTEVGVDIDDVRNIAFVATSTPVDSAQSSFVGKAIRLSIYQFDTDWDSNRDVNVRTSPSFESGNEDHFGGSVELINGEALITWEGEASDDSDPEGVFFAVVEMDGDFDPSETHIGGTLADYQGDVELASFHNGNEYAIAWIDGNGGTPVLNFSISNTFSNTPPSSNDGTVVVQENRGASIRVADLGYSDGETELSTIRINSLPGNGRLFLNGELVIANQEIDFEDLENGNLVFAPQHDFTGTTSMSFTVNDGRLDAALASTLTFDVQPTNDEAPIRFGDQFVSDSGGVLVNEDHLVGNQVDYEVAALDNGGYVVVFKDDTTGDVVQRVYDGNSQTIAYSTVSSGLNGIHRAPSITSLVDGGYVVSWANSEGNVNRIAAIRFDANGNEVLLGETSGPQVLFQGRDSNQNDPHVAGLDNGGFVVTWSAGSVSVGNETDILARIVDANGGMSEVFLVNQQVNGVQRDSVVSSLDGNRFVIAWIDQSVSDHDVKARIYDAGDLDSGFEFDVATNQTNRQGGVSLARLENGNFAAVWDSAGGLDGSGRGVFGSIFDANGVRSSPDELLINQTTQGHQYNASVIAENGGGFTVFFESALGIGGDQSGASLNARSFDADGNAINDDQLIETMHYGDQSRPKIARLANGEVILAFKSQDGDQLGVNNADGTNDYGYGVYHQVLRRGMEVVEGTTTSIRFDAISFDSSNLFGSLIIDNIPTGVALSDGVNHSGGNSSIDIKDWDLDNLTIEIAQGMNDDFELNLSVESIDGSDVKTYESIVNVEVKNSNDALSKSDLTASTTEDSVTTTSTSQIYDGLLDADLANLSQPAIRDFGTGSLPPNDTGTVLRWQDALNSSRNMTLDRDHVSYFENPNESIPVFGKQLIFDGQGGGTINSFAAFNANGAIELWIKPNSVSGEHLILDMGGAEQGLALFQVDDGLEVRFLSTLAGGLPQHEPYVLVAKGLSTSDFTQVVIEFARDTAGEGDPNGTDVKLYVNGQLRDQITDAPTLVSGEFSNESKIGIAQQSDEVVGSTATSSFAGSMASVRIFDHSLGLADVETSFTNVMNAPVLVSSTGQVLFSGDSQTIDSGATITIDDNHGIEYNPNGQFEHLASGESTTDTYQYRLRNAVGDLEVVNVVVTITGANDAPTVTSTPSFSTSENTSLSGAITSAVFDPDASDVLTFSLVSANQGGSISLQSDGTFTYTPDTNFFGTETISYAVSDGNGGTANGTFSIDVAAVNSPPTGTNSDIDIDETTTRTILVSDFGFNDVESTQFTSVRIVTTPTIGSLKLSGVDVTDGQVISFADINSGNLSYTDSRSDDSIEFQVFDGDVFSLATNFLSMNMVDLPEAPTSNDFTASTDEDAPFTFSLSDLPFADLDGDSLDHVRLVSLPTSGSLTLDGLAVSVGDQVSRTQIESGALQFLGDSNEFGVGYAEFDFVVNDGTLDSGTHTATIDINSVNDAPVSGDVQFDVLESQTRVFDTSDFPFTDVETSQFSSVRIMSLPGTGQLGLNGNPVAVGDLISFSDIDLGRLTYVGSNVDEAFTFQVSDGNLFSSTHVFELIHVPVADPPTGSSFARTIPEDSIYTVSISDLNFSDPDGDSLVHLEIRSFSGGGQLLRSTTGQSISVGDRITASEIANGDLRFVPGANEHGIGYASFGFVVNDGLLDSNVLTATFNVSSVNDLPTGNDQSFDVDERTTRQFSVADFPFADIESTDFHSIEISSLPTQGTLRFDGTNVTVGQLVSYSDIEDGLLVYHDREANDQFTYRVYDGIDFSTQAYEVTLNSIDLPENPEAVNDNATVLEGGSVVIDLTSNDVSNADGTISILSIDTPLNGTIVDNGDGTVTYTHDGSDTRDRDRFNYQIINSDGRTDSGRVRVSVTPVDDVAVAVDDSVETFSDSQLRIQNSQLWDNDVDPDSNISDMENIVSRQPDHGTIESRNGSLIYVPEPGFIGTDSFEYRLVNGSSVSNEATVTIDVTQGFFVTTRSSDNNGETASEESNEEASSESNEEGSDSDVQGGSGTTGTNRTSDSSSTTDSGATGVIAPSVEDARAQSFRNSNRGDEADNDEEQAKLNFELSNRVYNYNGRSEGLVLADLFSSHYSSISASMLSEFNSNLHMDLFFVDLDQATDSFLTEQINIGLPEVAVSAASLVTAGYLTWVIRGGVMLTTFVTQTPAYQYFDIGALLEAGKSESIESIVDQ